MGSQPAAMSQEQNVAAGTEALAIFRLIDVDADEHVSQAEWDKVFTLIDTNVNGIISRKEWYIKQGTTEMFDAFTKKSRNNLTKAEWAQGFKDLDTNSNGLVSVQEWMARRKVRLSFLPVGMGAYHWGVGAGDRFYELVLPREGRTDMAVLGPGGVIALSEGIAENEQKEEWLLWAKAQVEVEGLKEEPGSDEYPRWSKEKGEPRAHLEAHWQSFEDVGWTGKDEADIETWCKGWLKEHPSYVTISVNKSKEVNHQTFAVDFIRFLTNSNYWRMNDNDKGKALMIGGTVLAGVVLAGVGKSLVGAMTPKGENEKEDFGTEAWKRDSAPPPWKRGVSPPPAKKK